MHPSPTKFDNKKSTEPGICAALSFATVFAAHLNVLQAARQHFSVVLPIVVLALLRFAIPVGHLYAEHGRKHWLR